MSRKTKPRHSTPFRRISPRRDWEVNQAPHLDKPLALICRGCGALGKYQVGTVMLDPTIATSGDRDSFEKAAGFTGYFRCRACDAGGPWELLEETYQIILVMAVSVAVGIEDVPLIFGCLGTFDKRIFRYVTESEAHIKKLIDREPERAFLWTRLGNLYFHAGEPGRAEAPYRRAIELDPKDIEAHGMLGQVLVDTDRSLEGVPHWHAVLKRAREARSVKKEIRRNLVRGAIECLLDAHFESHGKIELLPSVSPEEFAEQNRDEPVVLEIRNYDLGTEEGLEDLCDSFLQAPRRNPLDLLRRRKRRMTVRSDDWPAAPVRRETPVVGRNAPCPCGSGHKYKKCCGR